MSRLKQGQKRHIYPIYYRKVRHQLFRLTYQKKVCYGIFVFSLSPRLYFRKYQSLTSFLLRQVEIQRKSNEVCHARVWIRGTNHAFHRVQSLELCYDCKKDPLTILNKLKQTKANEIISSNPILIYHPIQIRNCIQIVLKVVDCEFLMV